MRNIILLALFNGGVFFCILLAIHLAIVHKHWQTDPDVFIIPENKSYHFILLGTSHGQSFTRFSNQQMVENILGTNFLNLSQPNAGPLMEKIYVQLFLAKGNRTPTLVYFIDPQVFYTKDDSEANIHMLEKFPKALEQEDPLYYLMGEVMYRMKHYMIYKDPMVQRSRQVTLDPTHPITESGEAIQYELLPAPLRVAEQEAEYHALYGAVDALIPNRRNAIVRRYGLHGHPEESSRDIATSEGRTVRSVDSAVLNGRRSLAKLLSRN